MCPSGKRGSVDEAWGMGCVGWVGHPWHSALFCELTVLTLLTPTPAPPHVHRAVVLVPCCCSAVLPDLRCPSAGGASHSQRLGASPGACCCGCRPCRVLCPRNHARASPSSAPASPTLRTAEGACVCACVRGPLASPCKATRLLCCAFDPPPSLSFQVVDGIEGAAPRDTPSATRNPAV